MRAKEERHVYLLKEAANPKSDYYIREERARYAAAEDRDEYSAENVFWAPKQARWSYLQANAKQPTIGKLIDEAMIAIEKETPFNIIDGTLGTKNDLYIANLSHASTPTLNWSTSAMGHISSQIR